MDMKRFVLLIFGDNIGQWSRVGRGSFGVRQRNCVGAQYASRRGRR